MFIKIKQVAEKKETTEDTHPGKSPSALFTEISVFVTALLRFAIKSFLTKELKIQSDITPESKFESIADATTAAIFIIALAKASDCSADNKDNYNSKKNYVKYHKFPSLGFIISRNFLGCFLIIVKFNKSYLIYTQHISCSIGRKNYIF